ncbi:hypothetical protein GA0115254_107045 [Streptomyces sp. Ncost-T10-10d]|nr:hypothetical protein GA0115254_107045 [Streptomyces sp. Ncost-T10-10d]
MLWRGVRPNVRFVVSLTHGRPVCGFSGASAEAAPGSPAAAEPELPAELRACWKRTDAGLPPCPNGFLSQPLVPVADAPSPLPFSVVRDRVR